MESRDHTLPNRIESRKQTMRAFSLGHFPDQSVSWPGPTGDTCISQPKSLYCRDPFCPKFGTAEKSVACDTSGIGKCRSRWSPIVKKTWFLPIGRYPLHVTLARRPWGSREPRRSCTAAPPALESLLNSTVSKSIPAARKYHCQGKPS